MKKRLSDYFPQKRKIKSQIISDSTKKAENTVKQNKGLAEKSEPNNAWWNPFDVMPSELDPGTRYTQINERYPHRLPEKGKAKK